MQSSPRKLSSSSSHKASNKPLKSKTSSILLDNISDDLLQVMFKSLTIKKLIEIYSINTAFSKKKLVIEMEVVDLSDLIITNKTLDFLDKVLDKSKIKRIILNNTRFNIKTSEQFSGNSKIFSNITIKQLIEIYKTNTIFSKKRIVIEMKVVDLSDLIITKKTLDFLDKVLDKSKIKRIILNNTRFDIKTSEQFSGNNKIFENITIKQLIEIYKTNTIFSKKRIVIEMKVVDLSDLRITKKTLDFLDKVLDKSKIKKLILNNTRFDIKTSEQFSGNNKIFENVKELQIKDTTIDVKANYFLKKYLNIENFQSLKIKRLILDNIKFASDTDYEDFNYNIEYYQNLEELIISNFNSIEDKVYNADAINYFNELIEKIRVLVNLKKLRINHTDITAETDWDENLVFVDVFLETLSELVNLKYLKLYKNEIDEVQLNEIKEGITDRFYKIKNKNVWLIRK
jgi:hypothetical protein